ncbi:MMPL family transporter [Chloroflexota bacterium]
MRAKKKGAETPLTYSEKVSAFLERNSGRVILASVVLTLLLVIPLLVMGSNEQASEDPKGEVFDLRDDINDHFAPSVHGSAYIVESRTTDIITQSSLWELYQNEQRLKENDQKGLLAPEGLPTQSYLYEAYDIDGNRSFLGMYSLADGVQDVLTNDPRFGTTLETATDEQIKLAVYQLFSNPDTIRLKESLSIKANSEKQVISGSEIDYWTSPALILNVLADNQRLGGGTLEIGVGGGETVQHKEKFNLNVQRLLRGDEKTFRLWGVAIDLNQEADREGQTAGYFIMATVIVVVVIAGISLRSYWATALTGAGLGCLMIWLKGISNLIGLKGGLVIDLIVPIAMISLGVDFGLHALRRYQEEKRYGFTPGIALRAGFSGVLGALVLAMATDSLAFLSNTSAEIEAVIHFGIAAAIAVVSSFIILGIVLPLVMTHIDKLQRPLLVTHSNHKTIMSIFNSVGVAAGVSTSVILLLAVSEALGVAVLIIAVVAYIVVPLLILRRRRSRQSPVSAPAELETSTPAHRVAGDWFLNLVTGIAHHRIVVLMIIIGITTMTTIFAFRLETSFDAKDFFNSKSDFVVSLDKLDEHVGETSGEPGIAYIRGDLTDTRALLSIKQFITDSKMQISSPTVVDMLERIVMSEYAVDRVAAVTGVEITDNNVNGLPDSQDQIEATYAYMLTEGVSLDENTIVYSPDQIREVLFHDSESGQEDITILTLGIPGTREQQNVITARDSLTNSLEVIQENPTVTHVGLTGSPFTRLAQLDASTKTLQRSLPIAAAAAFLLLLIVMRSFRYAIVTIIPIGLVVAWLYGLMYLLNFPLNYVTATIGAVSLGIGIDYSIHVTARFREETHRATNKMQALRQAANGTGIALLASAVSSIVGFAIMGFTPMPLFSTYGILTAIMILLALLASIVVLPSLLLLVTPEK